VHWNACDQAQGQVNCAVPETIPLMPDTGVITAPGFFGASATRVTVPANPGTHCASPFASTVIPTMAGVPTPQVACGHQVTDRGVTGVGGLLKLPVAVNCTCRFAKFWASAVAGLTVMELSSRLLPHPNHREEIKEVKKRPRSHRAIRPLPEKCARQDPPSNGECASPVSPERA
jgi:hypothetical protein